MKEREMITQKKRKKDEGKRRKKQKEGIRGKRESQRAWAEARGNQ